MAMLCPQCNQSFEQRLHCPQCGRRLVYQNAAPSNKPAAPFSGWQQTPWGRILIGLVLAQGLFFGLRQLFAAGLLASAGEEPADFWATLTGLMVLQGLQLVGLLIGGVLAGAG